MGQIGKILQTKLNRKRIQSDSREEWILNIYMNKGVQKKQNGEWKLEGGGGGEEAARANRFVFLFPPLFIS